MKVNSVVYKKLCAQAEEAKDRGFIKLADGILDAIGPCPDEECGKYSYSQMQDDIHNDLWKIATRVMYYHNIKSCDAIKLEGVLEVLASELSDELESAMGMDGVIKSDMEPKIPGEK
jgi:hypothetical protein